ncbi:saccharopine dehydrogenase family protein [Chondrinema litorale]|uniref:saccharopine dehydrogenase family protein n=1 Tax=Chondrinema litorale TaxID=2994555 RepID=UPI0025433D5D|nr:saccharopine dehydrogenase family protein [Chondrinema litorale]UZR95451.1 saccharopine dehydrogenase NADP-binding domain-containing protein [Chondrinema litorale]
MASKKILLIGAGRSSNVLISFLLQNKSKENWELTFADANMETLKSKVSSKDAHLVTLDVNNNEACAELVKAADIVISMVPAFLHMYVARNCVKYGKNMVTASYVSEDMQQLDKEAKDKGVLLLNEIGLDPGLDHLSAMKIIDSLRDAGAEMLNFESFAGGLLAPESEKDNPWKYKFTWNPRNVVLAGQGTVKFIQEDRYKYIPYHRLFRRTEIIDIEGFGRFEGYPNRDSLKYIDAYNLRGIPTIFRGTLRRPGYCRAWNAFVQLGATDDSYKIEDSENMTYRQFINSFLSYNPTDSVELKLMHYLHLDQDSDVMEKLEWLGVFSDKKVGLKNATPAQILQKILEDKWSLDPDDKDMIVMWHQFIYNLNGKKERRTSSMVVTGEDTEKTAMAKTVGLPVGIATQLILRGEINDTGVKIPTKKSIYEPVLAVLEAYGIQFNETTEDWV